MQTGKTIKSIKTTGNLFVRLISSIKRRIISRMFWGRGSFYKSLAQFIMIFITVVFALGGVIYRVNRSSANQNVLAGGSINGLDDLLQQGASVESVLQTSSSDLGIKTNVHVVQAGETLDQIAKANNVTVDTIRWANPKVISPFTNEIQPGWQLTIPELNGVFYTVKSGQTLDDVISITSVNNTESNRFNIVEFNELVPPYTLASGQKIFIPDGNLIRPDVNNVIGIPKGVFINPLSNPACAGYKESRGFTSYHNGVDLARWPDCPIEAVANGVVEYAGWSNYGEGNNVRIDHGGGIMTHYYHGNGTFFVKTGDRVQQGQLIMMMGSTGNSTGDHLHFSLFKNGVAVNPYGYVPY